MITITKYPNDYCFTGNPVIFEALIDSSESINVEISIEEKTYSTTYYPFKISEGSYKVSMNISDFLHFENKIEIPEDGIISAIQGFSLPFQVKIGDDYIFNGNALRGGISNEAFLQLNENNYDIFSYRLLSYTYQFLFTTRTNLNEIKIQESELYPFIFIHPGVPLIFKSKTGKEIITQAQTAGIFCIMNIKNVIDEFQEVTDRIDVLVNGVYAFHFTILPKKISHEKYLLKFRNSFGAFEVLEVTGKAMHSPEFLDENLWEASNEYYFYEEHRSRVKSRNVIEVESGYKDRSKFSFIQDLIQSDEIYFIYPDGYIFRCHVIADRMQYRNHITEPTSVNLKIRAVFDEEFILPKIEYPDDIFFRIFDNTHDKTFN